MKTTEMVLIALLLAATTSSFAEDIPPAEIDSNELINALPQHWTLWSVKIVSSPTGWKTTSGDRGLRVSFANTNLTIKHFAGSYNPSYSFTLMPTNWTGSNRLGHSFADGRVLFRTNRLMGLLQEYPDRYVGYEMEYYFFESYLGRDTWEDPYGSLKPFLKKKENPVEPPPSPRTRSPERRKEP